MDNQAALRKVHTEIHRQRRQRVWEAHAQALAGWERRRARNLGSLRSAATLLLASGVNV